MAAPVWVSQELVGAAKMNLMPKGILGYAQVTANQAGITTLVDLTGLTATVTVQANRRIRITANIRWVSSVADDVFQLLISESTTVLQRVESYKALASASGAAPTLIGQVVITPSAGEHTYKLQGIRGIGTGTALLAAAATYPAFILVEDIGSSV